MELKEALTRAAVLGAAGKMGSGISLLLLQEIACLEAQERSNVGIGGYYLNLIDANEKALDGLRTYLKSHIKKFAERNIVTLRSWYSNNLALVDNEEIVSNFVEGALSNVRFGTAIEDAQGSKLIFEAIIEDIDAKASVFAKIDSANKQKPYYFSNTSSIPIEVLAKRAGIDGRLIGFHFYNPPAVQRLIEIIPAETGDPQLLVMSETLAKKLNKIVVVSKDVAGFIGNGHFMREIVFACRKVEMLASSYPLSESICLVNKATQDFLIRPMGIFQLLDYVGLDVYQRIADIMSEYLSDKDFHQRLILDMVERKIVGGQLSNGAQKDGFFHYENGRPIAIFNLQKNHYDPIDESINKKLGSLPEGYQPWKSLHNNLHRQEVLQNYFRNLLQEHSLGAELAKDFLHESAKIGNLLVKQGVAKTTHDVDVVLENGFYHLYGVNPPSLELAGRSP